MNYDHDVEPHRLSDFLPSAMTAELLRCIARSLMATADQMDGQSRQEPPRTIQGASEDDTYAF